MILEKLFRVHDDSTHTYLEIGYEPDCVETKDVVEIRSYSYNSLTNKFDIGERIAFNVNSIESVIEALSSFKKV